MYCCCKGIADNLKDIVSGHRVRSARQVFGCGVVENPPGKNFLPSCQDLLALVYLQAFVEV
jgi:hypothetical protein